MDQDRFSLRQRIRSFDFAFRGIADFVKGEHNAWLHLAATVVVVMLGFYTGINSFEWMAIVFAIGLVWVSEMFNTCIEKLIDFFYPEHHESIRLIKDIAAGAVLVASIIAFVIGLLVFIPYYF
jgi:diacylglycerol kinase (ATP)